MRLRDHRFELKPGAWGLIKLLAAAVLILLPALAWLQYSWLEQIADADRDRRERTLRTAAAQLAQDFDAEINKAVGGLQLEPGTVEQRAWGNFAARYQLWADSALSADIITGLYFVDAPPEDAKPPYAPPLRKWNPQTQTFEETAWPPELAGIHLRFTNDARRFMEVQAPGPRRPDRGNVQRFAFPQLPSGDAQAIVVPIMRITAADRTDNAAPAPPRVNLLGFEIIRLNHEALAKDVLPVLVRRHLYDDAGHSDYVAAVVLREDPTRIIYESTIGAAATALKSPDLTTALLGPRMGSMMFMSRDMRKSPVPPPPPPPPGDRVVVNVIEARDIDRAATMQTRLVAGEGHWRLVLKHRAGSLEAAVSAARTRNFMLSSGILMLLATAIGLIVVSARRADRLARQQLEFVAAVSHELRTPVSVIGAAAGNLADGVVDEPTRVKKYGATIQTEARRLAETVERVLQLAGIATGRAAASPSIIPARTLIDDALAAVRHEIDSAGVTVELNVPEQLPSVIGDALALRSALQNLIGNAVKYSGDARWLRVSAVTPATIGLKPARSIKFTVEDRGLGVAAEERKHIFEPFYRGREAVSRQIQGSGLGLHLVQRIAEAHGGSITVESETGRGSTFTLELPVVPDQPIGVAHHQSPVTAG